MKKLLLVLSLAALLFAGCGGGDDDDANLDTAGETSEAGSDDADRDDTDFSGEGGDDFCDLARRYEEDFEDTGQATTPDDQRKEFEELNEAIDDLASEAPSEIRADVNTVAEAFDQLTQVLDKYDYDITRIPEEEAAELDFEDGAVGDASDRVESYFETVCGIDSDDDGDTDGETDDSGGDGITDDTITE